MIASDELILIETLLLDVLPDPFEGHGPQVIALADVAKETTDAGVRLRASPQPVDTVVGQWEVFMNCADPLVDVLADSGRLAEPLLECELVQNEDARC